MENEKLIKIIEQLKEVRTATKSKVSDETLFDAGVRIYNSEQIETHRQGLNRKAEPPLFRKPQTDSSLVSPATQSQKNLMNKLKIKFSNNITKKEAQRLISEKLK